MQLQHSSPQSMVSVFALPCLCALEGVAVQAVTLRVCCSAQVREHEAWMHGRSCMLLQIRRLQRLCPILYTLVLLRQSKERITTARGEWRKTLESCLPIFGSSSSSSHNVTKKMGRAYPLTKKKTCQTSHFKRKRWYEWSYVLGPWFMPAFISPNIMLFVCSLWINLWIKLSPCSSPTTCYDLHNIADHLHHSFSEPCPASGNRKSICSKFCIAVHAGWNTLRC